MAKQSHQSIKAHREGLFHYLKDCERVGWDCDGWGRKPCLFNFNSLVNVAIFRADRVMDLFFDGFKHIKVLLSISSVCKSRF